MICASCRARLEFYESHNPPVCLRCEMLNQRGVAAFKNRVEGAKFMMQRAAGRPTNLFQHAHAQRRAVKILTAVRITGTTRYEYDVAAVGNVPDCVLRQKAHDWWPRFAEETDAELRGMATRIMPL